MRSAVRRLVVAAAVATLLAIVFASRAFTEFTPVRIKVLRAPIASHDGRIEIVTPASDRVVPPPAAIIWMARNQGSSAVELTLAVDGRAVCTRQIGPNRTERFDCQDRAAGAQVGGQTIRITGAAGAWSVSSLEVAVLHGRTSSPENLVILPKGSRAYAGPSTAFVSVLWIAVFAVLLVPVGAPRRRDLVIAHRAAAGVVMVLLAGLSLSPAVSSYVVIVSAETSLQWAIILCAWPLWTLGSWLGRPAGGAHASTLRLWSQRVALALGVLVAFGSSVRWVLQHVSSGNYSGVLRISREHFDHNTVLGEERETIRPTLFLDESGGYDGQWVYFMTFDPLLRKFHGEPVRYNGVVDAPPYRFGRMGLSAVTRLLTAGRWWLVPAVIVWLVLVGTVGAALALSQIARSHGRSVWMGALVVAVPGFWESVGTGLSEPLAAALMLIAMLAVVRQRWLTAAVVCAASLLTRETGLVCAVAILGYAAWRGHWRRAVLLGLVALGPLILWRLYVGFTLHSVWGLQAFLYRPDDIGFPFRGIIDLWSAVRAHTYYPEDPGMARAAISYPLLLATGLGLAIATTAASFNPCALAAAGYGLLAVSLRYGSIWVHVSNGQRGTFEVFVMLAVSATQSSHWPRWLRLFNVMFWTFAVLYVFYLSFNAGVTREGLADLI